MIYNITGILTTMCFVGCYIPQLIKMWKTKQADDLSYGLMLLSSGGSFFGFIHCFLGNNVILLISYALSFLLSASIVMVKYILTNTNLK